MATSTLDKVGDGGTSAGFTFGKPENVDAVVGATTPFIINDSDSTLLGSVTIAVLGVDGAGTTVAADSTTVTASFKLQPKSFQKLADVVLPAVNATETDDADQRYNTSTVTFTDVTTTHGTSAAIDEVLYVAFA